MPERREGERTVPLTLGVKGKITESPVCSEAALWDLKSSFSSGAASSTGRSVVISHLARRQQSIPPFVGIGSLLQRPGAGFSPVGTYRSLPSAFCFAPFLGPGHRSGLLRRLVPCLSTGAAERRREWRKDGHVSTVPIQEQACLFGKEQGTADSNPYRTPFIKASISQARTPAHPGHSLALGGR